MIFCFHVLFYKWEDLLEKNNRVERSKIKYYDDKMTSVVDYSRYIWLNLLQIYLPKVLNL